MKKVLRIIFSVIGFLYCAIAIFAILCLLNKNEYGYPQFGNKTYFVVLEDDKDLDYKKGDLIVLVKPKNNDVKEKEAVFFYDVQFKKNTINIGVVDKIEVINDKETTYHVGEKSFSSDYLVGTVNNSSRYGKIGGALDLILSKWGFFFSIIVPFFIMFLIVLFKIYIEIKFGMKNDN